MKRTILCVSMAMLLVLPAVCHADRGHIWPQPVHITEESQKAIMFHNFDEEILILGTELRAAHETPVLEFIPLPSEPEVSLAEGDPFEVIRDLIYDKKLEFEGFRAKGRTGLVPVDLLLSERLGVHDVSVIRVNDLSGFADWIGEFFKNKGIAVSVDLGTVYGNVEDYLSRGYRYFVFDFIVVEEDTRFYEPLVYRFESDTLYYPLKTSNIIGGSGTIDLILILPGSLGLLRSGSDICGLQQAFRTGGASHFEFSSSSKVYPHELETVYRDIDGFFGEKNMYMQVVRYMGDYRFEDDLTLDVSNIGPYVYKHANTYGYGGLEWEDGFYLNRPGELLTADEERDIAEARAQNNPEWIFDFMTVVDVLDLISTEEGGEN